MNSWMAAVLNSVWQAFAIAACLWAILKFARRLNAATRHAVWWAALVIVILLPGASIVIEKKQATTNPFAPAARIGAAAVERFVPPFLPAPRSTRRPAPIQVRAGSWAVALPLVWLILFSFQFARIVWSYRHVRALKLRAAPADPDLRRNFDAWMLSCRVKRAARLLMSAEVASPMAVGFRYPAVILPQSLPGHLSKEELDQVLLHELAHLARRDDWTNLCARLAAAVVALHPVALWILRRIEREREIACDDWVVSQTGEARPYAQSLARLFELCWTRRRELLASGMAGNPSQLGGRIEALLHSRREISPKASVVKVAVSVFALLVFALAAAGTPRWISVSRNGPPPLWMEELGETRYPVVIKAAAAPARFRRTASTAPVLLAKAGPQKPAKVEKGAPANGGLLAALVAAGYGDLSVDEIIEIKNSGIAPEFLKGMSQSGWGKLPPRELIDLRNHGISPDYAADLLDSGLKDLSIARVIDLHNQGIPPEFVHAIHALGFGPYDSRQIIDLHNHGVRIEIFRALKDTGYRSADPREIIDAAAAGIRDSDLREARQFGSGLTLHQIVKLKQAGVLR